MPNTILERALTGQLNTLLLTNWLNNESIEDIPEDCILLCCKRSDFAVHFLSYLRNQTDSILETNSNTAQILHHNTPEKIISTRRKHHRSISDPTSDDRTIDNLSVKTDHQRSHESPSKDRKRTGRRVKTKLFAEEKKEFNASVSSDESRLCTGIDRLGLSSTPVKNGLKLSEYPNLPLTSPVTPRSFVNKDSYERCDTPRLSHRHSRSHDKSCLGDYLVTAQSKSSKKKSKKNSNDHETEKIDLDLSNSDIFPEIGMRKSSSLRSDKRRIKPTNIDRSQKSFSLNSFNSENFQQTSSIVFEDNSAFKHQKLQLKESDSFEVERNILKQERHKLMEKFNILNTYMSPNKAVMPQIKVTQKDFTENKQTYINADFSKIVLKESIDILVEIYDILLKNNLILSVNAEIYFLISILISKQCEDDFMNSDKKLNDNNIDYLLKTIHNSTYFAVKSLWKQRSVLEIILDKNSLKILGENKKVRSFYPDLAKFLLNCYGLRCEAESQDKPRIEPQSSNGIICFNFETDNADNFPSILSFQNFKKQRDMFYEILRWYIETGTTGSSRNSFRTRVKTLISCGNTAANHAHLAALFTAHMMAECLPPNTQESKLSKLQRRLTCPAATESYRLPNFTSKEMFYKEFIMYAENESFRFHLRDALAAEIIILDSTNITIEDRSNSNNTDISKEFLQLSKKLILLSKFLGFLTSLPYSQVPIEITTKSNVVVPLRTDQREQNYIAPKEKVLENSISLRNYSQPTIDLKEILITANKNGRLSVTIPWIVHYLSMLDFTTLRINYYQNLLKNILEIYMNRIKLNSSVFKRNTIIYLKSTLGWFFDLPHFPQDLFYEKNILNNSAHEICIDCCDLIDESSIFELCPFLRELNVLLATCRLSQDQKEMGTYRHITPISLTLNPEDRLRNKEKELQSRLEEELLKSQPSSTRRVLELVIERVTSAAVRELTARALVDARERAREHARRVVRARRGEDNTTLLQALQALYKEELAQLRADAVESSGGGVRARAGAALAALLPLAPAPLHALALRGCRNRLAKWLHDNWNTTAVLCKDIESEMRTLIGLADINTSISHKSVDVDVMTASKARFDAVHVSSATCIINLKEQICLLLDDEELPDMTSLLTSCATSCSPNNLFCRPPTQRAILQLSIDLCIVFVSKKPKEVTETFLTKLHAIWNTCCPDRKRPPTSEISLPERRSELSPEFRNFDEDERIETPTTDDDTENGVKTVVNAGLVINPASIFIHEPTSLNDQPTTSDQLTTTDDKPTTSNNKLNTLDNQPTKTEMQPITTEIDQNMTINSVMEDSNDHLLEFFDRILCPRNIVLLSASKCVASDVWEALVTVLVFLLKNYYLSEDSLTEQCLAVYRQDWPQSILENLSTCMKSVSSRWARSSTGKFTLFLDFLAEYCGDMDYDPVE